MSGNMNGYQETAAGIIATDNDASASEVQAPSEGDRVEQGVSVEKSVENQEDTAAPSAPAATPTPPPPAVPTGPAQKTFSFSFGLLCNSDSGDKGAMIGRVMDKINDIACNAIGGVEGAEYKTELKALRTNTYR